MAEDRADMWIGTTIFKNNLVTPNKIKYMQVDSNSTLKYIARQNILRVSTRRQAQECLL